MAELGDTVYVRWDVGTQFGLAGVVTSEIFTEYLGRLIDDGFGRLTDEIPDEMTPDLSIISKDPPINYPLGLERNADLYKVLEPLGGEYFPDGTTAWIDIVHPATGVLVTRWDAAVGPAALTWIVQSSLTNAIPAGFRYYLYVSFPTVPTTEVMWFYGQIKRVPLLKSVPLYPAPPV